MLGLPYRMKLLDEYDLLCEPDRSGKPMRAVCPKKHANRLDCGHDDYFNTNPKPGSYLATKWNIATSEFLLRGDGGDDIPDVPGAVQPTPTPSTPASPGDAPAVVPPSPSAGAPALPPVLCPALPVQDHERQITVGRLAAPEPTLAEFVQLGAKLLAGTLPVFAGLAALCLTQIRLDLALELDRHRLAEPVHRLADREPDPADDHRDGQHESP